MKLTYTTGIFFLFFLGFSQSPQSQTNHLDVQEKLSSYFELPREQVYLHLNKTTYVSGEAVWLKAYVWDLASKMPSFETTNLEVSLYESDGKFVKSKLFFGDKGYASGNFEIDSLLVPGEYYIRGTTNWLRNFKESHEYVQRIQILGNDTYVADAKQRADLSYDLQFMPEGGHFLAGVDNTVGVKLLDSNGKGVPFQNARILDSKGNLITTFDSNALGLAKFSAVVEGDKTYRAKIILNDGEVLERQLPLVETEGIALKVVNTPGDYFYLQLNTNKNTYPQISNRPFQIIYHQDGNSSLGELSFTNYKLSLTTRIRKEDLYNGINTITILDFNGKPVLERLLFNNSEDMLENISIEKPTAEKLKDSVMFRFQLNTKKDTKIESPYHLSVSVLPENTISYHPKDNMLFSFLLKPYIKGYIDNPSYYFTDITLKKRDDLDLLLLTQGWSRYEWDNILYAPPKPEYAFEQGISLSTTIQKEAYFKDTKNDKGEVQFYIHPIGEQEQIVTAIGEDNKVQISNLYLTEGEQLKTSVLTPSGKMITYGNKLDISPKIEKNVLITPTTLSPVNTEDDVTQITQGYLAGFIDEKSIFLDEVVVKQRVDKEESNNNQLASFLSNDRRKPFKITAEEVDLFPNVLDIIRMKGFHVEYENPMMPIKVVQRFGSTFDPTATPTEKKEFRLSPILILDGVVILDFELLRNLRTYDIEDIYVNPRDMSQGARGAGGLIRINRRRTPIDYSILSRVPTDIKFIETPIDFGFQTPKKFYNPIYNSYNSTAYDSYGTVHWEPNIITDIEGSFVLKTPLTPNKSYTFFIEGMSESGGLISKKITWKPNENQ